MSIGAGRPEGRCGIHTLPSAGRTRPALRGFGGQSWSRKRAQCAGRWAAREARTASREGVLHGQQRGRPVLAAVIGRAPPGPLGLRRAQRTRVLYECTLPRSGGAPGTTIAQRRSGPADGTDRHARAGRMAVHRGLRRGGIPGPRSPSGRGRAGAARTEVRAVVWCSAVSTGLGAGAARRRLGASPAGTCGAPTAVDRELRHCRRRSVPDGSSAFRRGRALSMWSVLVAWATARRRCMHLSHELRSRSGDAR
jgi:hypothetical protein